MPPYIQESFLQTHFAGRLVLKYVLGSRYSDQPREMVEHAGAGEIGFFCPPGYGDTEKLHDEKP